MKKPKTFFVNTRLSADEARVIRELAIKEYEGNESAALRKIVREWDELKKQDCKDSRPTG